MELFHIGLQLIDEVLLISFRGTDMPVTGQVLGVLSGFGPDLQISTYKRGNASPSAEVLKKVEMRQKLTQ